MNFVNCNKNLKNLIKLRLYNKINMMTEKTTATTITVNDRKKTD